LAPFPAAIREDDDVEILKSAGAYTAPGNAPNHWVEHLSVPDLSVGTYSIPAGGLDDQRPHTEDEIYLVTAGRARIVTSSGSAEVGPGSVIYVPAAETHQFVDITEDLALVVVFAPPYESRATWKAPPD
jgi:mannose-6-phosphate isomerase-like protein (cupin superfamily)